MTIVFVYGTLMRRYGNNYHLGNSEYLGQDQVKGKLYDLGPFPAAVKGRGVIHGEIYNVDIKTLDRLDRLEGHPRFYERTRVQLFSGQWADMYLFKQALKDAPLIESGKWVATYTRP